MDEWIIGIMDKMIKTHIFLLFSLFASSCNDTPPLPISQKPIIMGIQPFGNFDHDLVDTIQQTIKAIYSFEVIILPPVNFPINAFINVKTPRYRADTLLYSLSNMISDSIDYIMGVTHCDISTTKRDKYGDIKEPAYKYTDWGVFGLGFCPGPACIISTKRIHHTEQAIFIERIKKISVHELGHNLGLNHCESEVCVMRDACERIATVDQEKLELCDKCKQKIASKIHQ